MTVWISTCVTVCWALGAGCDLDQASAKLDQGEQSLVGGSLSVIANVNQFPFRHAAATGDRQVWAHWHGSPIRDYEFETNADLNLRDTIPTRDAVESRDTVATGGAKRYRPLFQDLPADFATYRVADALKDIELADTIGVDAFLMNTGSGPEDTKWQKLVQPFFDACTTARRDGRTFSIAINLDGSIIAQQARELAAPVTTAAEWRAYGAKWADRIQGTLDHECYLKRPPPNDRAVVGFFNPAALGVNHGRAFLEGFRDQIASAPGPTQAFLFLSMHGVEIAELEAYNVAPSLVDGTAGILNAWSVPTGVTPPEQFNRPLADWASQQGVPFSFSARIGKTRTQPIKSNPDGLTGSEANGFGTFTSSWQAIIAAAQPADDLGIAQIVSWSDLNEAHDVRPNTAYQRAFYDLTAYYIQHFKTGRAPVITHDVIYYAHRLHSVREPHDTELQGAPFRWLQPDEVDQVYLIALATGAATVNVQWGPGPGQTISFTIARAGVRSLTAPFPLDLADDFRPGFRMSRAGEPPATGWVRSAFRIRGGSGFNLIYQDMVYRAGSTARPTEVYRAGSATRPAAETSQDTLPQDRCEVAGVIDDCDHLRP